MIFSDADNSCEGISRQCSSAERDPPAVPDTTKTCRWPQFARMA